MTNMEKVKITNSMPHRFLLLSGFALVALGLVTGYAGRDLFLGNSHVSAADTLSKDSVSGSGQMSEGGSPKHLPNTTNTELKQNAPRVGSSLVQRKANLNQQTGDQISWIDVLSEERTANIDVDIGGLYEDPDSGVSDPDRVAELTAKHEFEHQQLEQQKIEMEILLAPPSLDLDDDSLEDAYLVEHLPEIDVEGYERMFEVNEQEAGYPEQVDSSLPHHDSTETKH